MTSSRLSPRQREIANLTADGLRPEQIGAKLGVKTTTVRSYITRILRKKGFEAVNQLCAYVYQKRMKKLVNPIDSEQLSS